MLFGGSEKAWLIGTVGGVFCVVSESGCEFAVAGRGGSRVVVRLSVSL